MKSGIIWLLAGVILAASVIGGVVFWRAANVDTEHVDKVIRDGIASADAELWDVVEHLPRTQEKVVVIRERVAKDIMALDPDELVTVALSRADKFRRRLVASADTASPAWMD